MGGDHCQDRVPLRDESEMVGHSVLSTYLYAGATDVFLETGEQALIGALQRLWRNHTERKMFVHGGACALPNGLSGRGDRVHEAVRVPEGDWDNPLYKPLATATQPVRIRLIPCFARANRGPAAMSVCLPLC